MLPTFDRGTVRGRNTFLEAFDRVTLNDVGDLEETLADKGQEHPDFLYRETQIAAIASEYNAIADEAIQIRDAPDGPKKRIGVLMQRINYLRGQAKGKKAKGKKPALTDSFSIPDRQSQMVNLAEQLQAEVEKEKEQMKNLTETIKPAQKGAKNIVNFDAILDEKRKAAAKARKIEEMELIKQQKEEAAAAAEAMKEELIAESQAAWKNASPLVKQIMAILETVIYRGLYGDDFDSVGRGALAAWLEDTVETKEELTLYMLAFPFKAASTAKTLSPYLDLAEVAALQTLGRLLTELNAVYAPGARFVLISDGVTFSDIYRIRDDMMLAYLLKVQEYCSKIHPKLECRSMYDVFPEKVCNEAWDEKRVRDEIFDVYQPDEDWVMMQREIDAGFKSKGADFQKFLYEDVDPKAFPNNTQRNNDSKKRSIQMLQRDEALRIFTMGALPNAVRVSIRPRSQAGPTYCINMIGSTQRETAMEIEEVVDLTTPWHNVLVRIDENDSDRERTELLPTDKRFYIRAQFVKAFPGAKPIVDKDGITQGYSIPKESLEDDPTKGFDSGEEFGVHELPPLPTEEEARLNRKKAVENAIGFGWSKEVTAALKVVGDRLLNKEVTRDMVVFGAGNDALLLA